MPPFMAATSMPSTPSPVPFVAGGGPPEAWRARPYQQVLRGPRFRWWRPLLSTVILLGGVGAVLGLTLLAGVAYYLLTDVARGGPLPGETGTGSWEATPAGMLVTNLLLAALIPIVMLAVWGGFGWRPRWIASVTGGVRWGWLAVCALASIVVVVLPSLALTLATEDPSTWKPERQWPALAAVVLLTTPLQAAGEEYLFRGWLPQTIGSVIRNPRVGALAGSVVATTLFALAHGDQDPWLFADRFTVGAVACWLVWWTGGLEAGMALHAVNNLTVFGFTLAEGGLADSLSVTEASPSGVAVDVATLVVAAVVIGLVARRRRVVRLFTPPRTVA
jgi:membrane protease YdiL (CAAX protease family)